MERQEYLITPAEVEVHFLSDSNKTDIILRKDIQQEEKQNYETLSNYYVYTCEEIQGRVEGQYTEENIQSNFDVWWMLLEQEEDNNAAKLTYEFQSACGEYMGTGCYGENNPNILSLNFTPTFLSISDENGNSILYNGQLKNGNLIFQNTVDGIQWYSPIGPINQFNEINKKYYYNAFGKIQI